MANGWGEKHRVMRKLTGRRGNPAAKAARAVVMGAVAGLLVFVVEALLAIPGPDDHFHNPSPQPMRFGGPGKALLYVVMGDSTAAGRGAPYDDGIAVQTARHLAQSRPVTLVNVAVSGAKIGDVVRDQLPTVLRLKPDVVLLAMGANDVTHFTPGARIGAGLTAILTQLAAARPGVRVVLTGSPDVGTARRFLQPLRWLAGRETLRVNAIMQPIARQHGANWAPIAQATGPLFARDPTLFAPDRFHPNARGYATWLPALDVALDKALQGR